MEAASNLIKQLGRLIGLDELALDDSGQCTLAFDESIVLTFVGDPDGGLNVVSYIGDLARDNAASAQMLLAHNFVPSGLGGGRVAVEPESSRAVLVNRWDSVRTDFGFFQHQLETFVNAVESIRKDLDAVPASQAAPAPAPAQRAAPRREDAPPPGAYI
jgi:hypothetical protein